MLNLDSNTREQAVKHNFINTFMQSLTTLYQVCSEESSWSRQAADQARNLVYAGVSYWALRNITDVQTPYGKVKCNPASCILLLSCMKAKYDYDAAQRSERVAGFFESAEECSSLAQKVAEELYERFEFTIQLLVNGPNGVKRLANFFVDAIAQDLSRERRSTGSIASKQKELISFALPDRGSAVYFSNCLEKKVKLNKMRYVLPIQDGGYKTSRHLYFSIMGIITASPAFLKQDSDTRLYIQEGTRGEYTYPPQCLIATNHNFVVRQEFIFDKGQYRTAVAVFSDSRIGDNVKQNHLSTESGELTSEEEILQGVADMYQEAGRREAGEIYRREKPITSLFYVPASSSHNQKETELAPKRVNSQEIIQDLSSMHGQFAQSQGRDNHKDDDSVSSVHSDELIAEFVKAAGPNNQMRI